MQSPGEERRPLLLSILTRQSRRRSRASRAAGRREPLPVDRLETWRRCGSEYGGGAELLAVERRERPIRDDMADGLLAPGMLMMGSTVISGDGDDR
jgi:hypothetical protein